MLLHSYIKDGVDLKIWIETGRQAQCLLLAATGDILCPLTHTNKSKACRCSRKTSLLKIWLI